MENSQKDKYIETIQNLNGLTNEQKQKIIEKLKESVQKDHILFLGKKGVGKSSELNLIEVEKSKVGDLFKPCTQEIQEDKFCNNLILYDTPGLREPSNKNKKIILEHLNKKDDNGKRLIDDVFFIYDANFIAHEE